MAEYIVRETGYPGAVKQEIVGELVRCKDCRFFDRSTDFTFCKRVEVGMDEDDYCSFAERRDDDRNG